MWEILNNRTIKPHRMKYYLDRKDPDFEPKAKNVLLVYKRIEWVLQLLDSYYTQDLTINIILDNHSIHRSTETMEYLASVRQDRFNFIFTPTHASWLNLIECFFSKLSRQALRNLRVQS